MSDKELLGTRSGVSVLLRDADAARGMPVRRGTPVYEINTGLRSEIGDCVILTLDEATRTALVILRAEFARRGMGLASAPLHTVGRLLGFDLENLPW